MKSLTAYFKSPVGVLKLSVVIVVAVVVALSSYSHFNSHWVLHDRTWTKDGSSGTLMVSLNGYEDCLRSDPTITGAGRARGGTTYIMTDSGEPHMIASEISPASESLACPNPILELVLVSASISILLLTFLFLLFICGLPKPITPRLWCQIKLFELIFHGLCSFFLLLGAALFIYSAICISDWCTAIAGRGTGGSGRALLQERSHHDDITVVKTVAEDDPTKGGGSGFDLNSAELSEAPRLEARYVLVPGLAQGRSQNSASGGKEKNSGDEDFCNARALIMEKYWASAFALLAAILYALLVYFIYRHAKNSAIDCSFLMSPQEQQGQLQTVEGKKSIGITSKDEDVQGREANDQNENNTKRTSAELQRLVRDATTSTTCGRVK